MREVRNRREIRTVLATLFGVLLVWVGLAWYIADRMTEADTLEIIQSQSAALDELTGKTAQTVDLGLDYLHEVPSLVAKDKLVLANLSLARATAPSATTIEARRLNWTRNPYLARVNSNLAHVSRSLDADILWITNAAGDCVASSNSPSPDSLVGTNFADRDYFRMAQAGESGLQYAVGRKTNIPGLFFSAPITIDGEFAGVAVAKVDLPKLAHLVSQPDSFITDKNGIIILARDPTLEMRSLPGAGIAKLSNPERYARYKRVDFPILKIVPWENTRFPTVHRFDQDAQAALISNKELEHEALGVHALRRVQAAADFDHDRQNTFIMITTAGALVIAILAGMYLFALIRKHSEIRTEHAASLLRAAIESTADGILVVDNRHRITTYNKRLVDIWKIPEEVHPGEREQDMVTIFLDKLEGSTEFLARVKEIACQPALQSKDDIRLKDGTELERYSLPQRVGEAIVGRVWSYRDVTAQRKAERELRESRDELELRVQMRTGELQSANQELVAEKAQQEDLIKRLAEAHNQLLQSEKMASIGQLAAGVAHEINNPVGFVNSNMTTLQKYVTDLMTILSAYERGEVEMSAGSRAEIERLKQEIDVAFLREDVVNLVTESMDGLQRVKGIVQDLKDFSHVDKAEKTLANIHQGLDSTLNVVWNEIKYKAEVVKDYHAIPDIECIPSQINQVFMNLLVNAAQAIDHRGQITLRTGQEGDYIWIEVADTGRGIPSQNLNRIFDPFFTTKPIGKGTGLGLSLSYGIVEKHGGRFEVKSEVGKGSLFRLWLPVRQPEPEAT
jgi:C4-dicarboxylate-specific signal transduction histidine kinase